MQEQRNRPRHDVLGRTEKQTTRDDRPRHRWWSDEEAGIAIWRCGWYRSRRSPRSWPHAPPSAVPGPNGTSTVRKARASPRRLSAAARPDTNSADEAEQPPSGLDDAVHGHDRLGVRQRTAWASPVTGSSATTSVSAPPRSDQLYLRVARLRHELSARCEGVRRGRQSLCAGADHRRDDRMSRHAASDSARVRLAGRGHVLQHYARMGGGERRSRRHRVRDPQRRQSCGLNRDDAVRGQRSGVRHDAHARRAGPRRRRQPLDGRECARWRRRPALDSTAPSTPGQLVVRGSNETSVTVELDHVERQRRCRRLSGLPRRSRRRLDGNDADYTVSGLACARSYRIEVDAYDAAGNRSGRSARTVTTQACPSSPHHPLPGDTTAPSVPTGVTVTSATSSSISLGWTASVDNVGVTGYGLYRDGVAAGSSTLTNATFSGLACGRSYQLAIDARDAARQPLRTGGDRGVDVTVPGHAASVVPPALTQAGATETTPGSTGARRPTTSALPATGSMCAGVRVGSTSLARVHVHRSRLWDDLHRRRRRLRRGWDPVGPSGPGRGDERVPRHHLSLDSWRTRHLRCDGVERLARVERLHRQRRRHRLRHLSRRRAHRLEQLALVQLHAVSPAEPATRSASTPTTRRATAPRRASMSATTSACPPASRWRRGQRRLLRRLGQQCLHPGGPVKSFDRGYRVAARAEWSRSRGSYPAQTITTDSSKTSAQRRRLPPRRRWQRHARRSDRLRRPRRDPRPDRQQQRHDQDQRRRRHAAQHRHARLLHRRLLQRLDDRRPRPLRRLQLPPADQRRVGRRTSPRPTS